MAIRTPCPKHPDAELLPVQLEDDSTRWYCLHDNHDVGCDYEYDEPPDTVVVSREGWEKLTSALAQLVAGITVTDCYKHIPDAYLKEARQVLAETKNDGQWA